jgi:hypothetical protein
VDAAAFLAFAGRVLACALDPRSPTGPAALAFFPAGLLVLAERFFILDLRDGRSRPAAVSGRPAAARVAAPPPGMPSGAIIPPMPAAWSGAEFLRSRPVSAVLPAGPASPPSLAMTARAADVIFVEGTGSRIVSRRLEVGRFATRTTVCPSSISRRAVRRSARARYGDSGGCA